MKLINTTRSHQELVRNQLENTDATLVEIYSAGNTDVIFTQAPKHYELIISNKYRAIKEEEINLIRAFFMKRKIDSQKIMQESIQTIHTSKLIEISIPIMM